MDRKVLIFTRNVQIFNKNTLLKEKIVVSDNYDTFKKIEKKLGKNAVLMDLDVPLKSKETWEVVKKVNDIIDSISLYEPSMVYEMSYLIETGITQELHDCIYLISYFTELIEGLDGIDEIMCDRTCKIECYALEAIARSKGIKYIKIGKGGLIEKAKNIIKKRYLLRNVLSLTKYQRIKRRYKRDKNNRESYDIGFIHNADSSKRIRWLKDEISPKESLFKTCVICMTEKSYKELRDEGHDTVLLYRFFKLKENIISLFNCFKDNCLIRNEIKKKLLVEYKNIDLKKTTYNLITKYIGVVSYKNIIDYNSFKGLFEAVNFSLLTARGDTNFIDTRLAHKAIKYLQKNSLFYREIREPLEVDSGSMAVYEPYADVFNFRIFNPGHGYLKELLKRGWVGKYYLCEIDRPQNNNQEEKKGTYENNKLKILWAPSYPFRGIYSIHDFIRDTETIMEQCKSIDCELYIKNHPNQSEYFEHWYQNKANESDNIKFVSKNELINCYIMKVDLVITTPSTVIMDAARMSKPVVCMTTKPDFVKPLQGYFYITNHNLLDLQMMIDIDYNEQFRKMVFKQDSFFDDFVYINTDLKCNDVLREKIQEVSNAI